MQKLSQLFNSALKYLVAAIFLAVPLYPKFPLIEIPGTYVAIRLEDLLMAAVAVLVFVKYLPRLKSLFKNDIERAIILFLLVSLLSLVSAIFLTKTVVFHIGILHWIRRVEYLTAFFAGLVVLRNREVGVLDYFLKILMIVVFVAFFYGYGQKHFNFPVIITQNEEYAKGIALRWIPGSHINSTFAGHYDLATFLVLILPIFISSFFLLKDKKLKMGLLVVIFSGFWLMSNAISRISVVSFLGGTTLALILLRKYKEIGIFLLISVLFFAFSTDLLARYTRIIEVTQKGLQKINKLLWVPDKLQVYGAEEIKLPQRRVEKETPTPTPMPIFEDRSTSIRLNVEWPRAIRALSKNPLLGTGFSSITLATDNDYLRLLGEVGILGFFSFLLIFVRVGLLTLKNLPLYKHFSGAPLAFLAGTIGGSMGIFLNAAFIDVFEASKFAIIFWLMVGIMVSLLRKTDYE